MPHFRTSETMRHNGVTIQDVHYSLSNTIVHSEFLRADLRRLDRGTGRFEIVLTGVINKDYKPVETRPEMWTS